MNKLKIYLIASFIIILKSVLWAQDQVIIEVNTDKYPEENKWVLFDADKVVVAEQNSFLPDTVNRDTLILDESKCYYWSIFDDYGDGMSASPGTGFKIYFKGNILAESTESNFGDSTSIYGIGSACVANDASVFKLTFNTELTYDPFNISAEILNVGSTIITSIEYNYSINGEAGSSEIVDNIQLEPGQTINIVHPNFIELEEADEYIIGFKVLSINNIDDENLSNNERQKTVNVVSGFKKIPMFELFTSSTCPPCVQGNLTLDGVLDNYSPNNYSLIKYQANWPGSGDPYYTPEVGRMISIYSVSGVPSLYENTKYTTPATYTVEDFDVHDSNLSDIGLKLSANVKGDSVYATASVRAAAQSSTDLNIRIAVVEKTTYDNASTNGEKEFHNVFMKFVTEWSGFNMGAFNKAESKSFQFAESLAKTNIEELSDLKVVAYVFTTDSYSILQSDMVEAPYEAIAPAIDFSIPAGAVNIDTLPTIEIVSNRPLFMSDSTKITDINEVIIFKPADSDSDVSFSGSYHSGDYKFTIIPSEKLDEGTTYFVGLKNIISNEGIEVFDQNIVFTTLSTVSAELTPQLDVDAYPNPIKSLVTIQASEDCLLTIYNVQSQQIGLSQELLPGTNTINMSKLHKGIYFLKIETQEKSKIIKVIKQ